MKNLFGLLIILFCFACNDDPEMVEDKAIIAGAISSFPGDKISIINPNSQDKPIELAVTDGQFHGEIDLNKNNLFYIGGNRMYASLYVTPGDSIYIEANGASFLESMQFSGDRAGENQYFLDRIKFDKKINLDSIFQVVDNFEGFESKLDSTFSTKRAFLEERSDQFADNDFVKTQLKWLDYDQLMARNNYASQKNRMTESMDSTAPLLDLDFARVDWTDEDLLSYPGNTRLVQTYLAELEPKFSSLDLKTSQDYYTEFVERALTLPESEFKTKTVGGFIGNLVDFGHTIEAKSYMEDYLALSPDSTAVAKLEEGILEWQAIEPGQNSPAFVAHHLDDSEFSIGDLKGKVVYVDVWATWCGPCKVEIPHLKALEEEYHGKDVVFLSVSIDSDEDIEKWKTFVEEQELGGMQVHAPKAWKSDLVQSYLIKGIPRFILLDQEGKIVSNNAPRPSSGEVIKEELNKLLASS